MEPETEYRLIEGFPGYRVGDDGSVWSRMRMGRAKIRLSEDWHVVKPQRDGLCGHKKVTLCPGYKQKKVHALVLIAFVGPCPEGLEALHADGDAGNNRLGNLRWGTRKENCADTDRHGRTPKGEQKANSDLTERAVMDIRNSHIDGEGYGRLMAKYQVSRSAIYSALVGRTWRHLPNAKKSKEYYR